MVFGVKQTNYEAVLFLRRNKVLKEMLYSEFEAVLDGVVGEPEFKGDTCHAVYLKVDMQLNIRAAVFFIIEFDEHGNADRRWNLPLTQMAETAPATHQLNGQAIRIACRSQCQAAPHQEHLWEPNLTAEGNTLVSLASSVKANRMGLLVSESDATGAPNMPSSAEMGVSAQGATGAEYEKVVAADAAHDQEVQKLSANLKKQQLYIASVKTRYEQDLDAQRDKFAREKECLMLQLEEACSTLKFSEARNQQMQQDIVATRQEREQQREHFEQQLSAGVNQQGVDFSSLQQQSRRELQQKLLEQTSELKARLEMRDVEAHYREEQINSLKKQLAEAGSTAVSSTATWQSAIVDLESAGVSFMLSLPAMRPMNIPAAELSVYSSEPDAYIATRLGLELATYQAWREHARNPVCVEQLTEDCFCGARLEIVRPQEFIADLSDHCLEHRERSGEQRRVGQS